MDASARIRTVTVVGVGLIGGSFALALRHSGFQGRILGVSSPATIEQALALRVIDQGYPLKEGVAQADLVYLANPIGRIVEQLPLIAGAIGEHALVTDAGSTKQLIVAEAARHFQPGMFLGGHPMAGKESRGVAAADAHLFEGRPYIVTPEAGQDMERPIIAEFLDWIRRMGALLIELSPITHDQRVALASHLPQLCSTALSAMLSERDESPFLTQIAGPGLFDMTRLALSSHDVWTDILRTNRAPLLSALDEYLFKLQEVRNLVATGETGALFSAASSFAKRIRKID